MVWRYSIANKTSGQNIQNPNNRLKKLFSELQELDCLSYICIVSRYKDYTFDYDDMAGYLHYMTHSQMLGKFEYTLPAKF